MARRRLHPRLRLRPGGRLSAPILLVGFGPFLDVADNPAARLVRALDGVRVEGPGGAAPIVGRVMPVSWRGCVEVTAALADALAPRAILGVGVARARAGACVERVGRRFVDPATPDVDGVCLGDLDSEGPAERRASLPEGFAAALDAQDSDDAGTYVCNAWLYQALARFRVPTGFLHVPMAGVDPERLRAALAVLLDVPPPASGVLVDPPL